MVKLEFTPFFLGGGVNFWGEDIHPEVSPEKTV